MASLTDTAAAKVNLTLEILGRRPDGYHELVSLVAFAEIGDRIRLTPGDDFRLELEGPFAAALAGDNLVERAVRRARRDRPGLRAGAFHLEKNLPVAAGLGGGSADAAATLRLLTRADPDRARRLDLAALGADLGADVRVCLGSEAALMWGVGEKLAAVPPLPELYAVLVNPGVALATAEVYAALAAPPLAAGAADRAPEIPGPFPDLEALVSFLQTRGNDLEAPALGLAPQIRRVLSRLRDAEGCRLARLTGSGATCFGLFAARRRAERAAERIGAAQPDWWVAASSLR